MTSNIYLGSFSPVQTKIFLNYAMDLGKDRWSKLAMGGIQRMNYLAHIHLSGSNLKVAVGNFIGDGVKGLIPKTYPREIYIGLHLHRYIDHIADSHPVNLKFKESLYPVFGRYAGIAQDMIHDHYLAINWRQYADQPLLDYLQEFYTAADPYLNIFPSHQRRFFEGVRAGHWISNYATNDGMQRSFEGLSKRIGRENPLVEGGAYIRNNHEELNEHFTVFYPILQELVGIRLKELLTTT